MNEVYHQDPLFVFSRVCKTCGIEKPIEQFYLRRADNYRYTHCKICLRATINQKRAASRPPTEKPQPINGGKFCSACRAEKPLHEFNKSRGRKGGVDTYCRDCSKIRGRQLRERQGYRRLPLPLAVNGGQVCSACRTEKPLADFPTNGRRKNGRGVHCKECTNRTNRTNYARRDTTQERAHKKEWYRTHTAEHRAMVNAWYEANPLKRREMNRRYNIRRYTATKGAVDYQKILDRDNYWCYICDGPILPGHKIDFDHRIPVSRQGPHSEENIFTTHSACNRRKAGKLFEELTAYERRGVRQ